MIPDEAIAELPEIQIDVLNCGLGDLKLTYDPENVDEVADATAAIQKMLKSGYALFVEVDGKLEPVVKFDANRGEYVLKKDPAKAKKKPGRPVGTNRVKAAGKKVHAVPRSGGG